MHNLDPRRLAGTAIPLGTSWLLGDCMEARGKQDLWTRQKPETLAALREQALIQSVESSNRIEGVTVPNERLRPLVLRRSKPRDRSEEELAGYRRALDWIFARRPGTAPSPALVRRLHALAQSGHTGDAGEWKQRDNEIIEIARDGRRRVRFVPTPARQTPKAMEALCRSYGAVLDAGTIPPLLLIATFVFDFLCIHPFRDGNGRVSRLLASLLLETQGYCVARYISLERLVEERKSEYYEVLERSSQGWHEGTSDILPWWNFFLAVLRSAYQEFEKKVESAGTQSPKSGLVEDLILDQAGPFTLAEIAAQTPGVSVQLVKRVLSQLKASGHVHLEGRGRGALWQVQAKPASRSRTPKRSTSARTASAADPARR